MINEWPEPIWSAMDLGIIIGFIGMSVLLWLMMLFAPVIADCLEKWQEEKNDPKARLRKLEAMTRRLD